MSSETAIVSVPVPVSAAVAAVTFAPTNHSSCNRRRRRGFSMRSHLRGYGSLSFPSFLASIIASSSSSSSSSSSNMSSNSSSIATEEDILVAAIVVVAVTVTVAVAVAVVVVGGS